MSETATSLQSGVPARKIRYEKAAELLNQWLAEDSQYDADTWEYLEAELQDATCDVHFQGMAGQKTGSN